MYLKYHQILCQTHMDKHKTVSKAKYQMIMNELVWRGDHCAHAHNGNRKTNYIAALRGVFMCPACDVTCITCVSIYFCIDPTDASIDFVAFSN